MYIYIHIHIYSKTVLMTSPLGDCRCIYIIYIYIIYMYIYNIYIYHIYIIYILYIICILSVCLLYWYKSSNTDAEGAGRTAELLQRGLFAKDLQQPVGFFLFFPVVDFFSSHTYLHATAVLLVHAGSFAKDLQHLQPPVGFFLFFPCTYFFIRQPYCFMQGGLAKDLQQTVGFVSVFFLFRILLCNAFICSACIITGCFPENRGNLLVF